MKRLIIHHFDADGFGAAYAAWTKFGDDAEYLSINYGDPVPDVAGREVFILDFSFPREVLAEEGWLRDSALRRAVGPAARGAGRDYRA